MSRKSCQEKDAKLFIAKLEAIANDYEELVSKKNRTCTCRKHNWYETFRNPVLTRDHVPPSWRYDFNPETNPLLLERLSINAVFNPGAIEFDGKVCLVCRIEGADRKSFFGIAESKNGIDKFKFRTRPILIPQTDEPDTNVYDMRLTKHEDGWIYGTFCTERKDKSASQFDSSSAIAQCGIVRTKDLDSWERLPDLKTKSPQQRNVVLHPEFVNGKYAFYTRPQDGFISTGSGGGIAWGLSDSMSGAKIDDELVMDERIYHTIKEVKNGAGAVPIKTDKGWLHIAHGVRNTAAGLRYVVYVFLCSLEEPWKLIASPGGYFIAPFGTERIGDVSNVIFCNGAVLRQNGELLIYYASSDTRIHLARTNLQTILDYAINTPQDPLFSSECVKQRIGLIENNLIFLQKCASKKLKNLA